MTRHTITWSLQPSRTEGMSHIRMRVAWNKCKSVTTFLIGYAIEPDKWSSELSRVRLNTTHGKAKTPAYVINRRIDMYERRVSDIMEASDNPSVGDFRFAFLRSIGSVSDGKTVTSLWTEWMQENNSNSSWSLETNKKYMTMRSKLQLFSPSLTISGVTPDTLQRFCNWEMSRGSRNSTVSKDISAFKTFLRWCRVKGYYTGCATDYRPKLRGSSSSVRQIVWLTWEELMRIYNCPNLTPAESAVKDCFCFMCLTSLRYSDIERLRKSDIYDGVIHIVTHKTADAIVIELNDYSQAILDKYADSESDLALPIIVNQKMNVHLKNIAFKAGINTKIREVWYVGSDRNEREVSKWELVSCHTGRHTFIVNALSMGISPQVVMKWTGHTNWKSMKPYVDIVDSAKSDAMKLFNKR